MFSGKVCSSPPCKASSAPVGAVTAGATSESLVRRCDGSGSFASGDGQRCSTFCLTGAASHQLEQIKVKQNMAEPRADKNKTRSEKTYPGLLSGSKTSLSKTRREKAWS